MRKTRYSQTPYIAFPKNCSPNLSIDETALSKDELFTTMMESVRISFPQALVSNDRFHVQQLFNGAMDDLRIEIRHQVRKDEATVQEMCREAGQPYSALKARNGETWPQILVRTKRALTVSPDKWSVAQKKHMEILFENYPQMQQAYGVMQNLRNIFNQKVYYQKGGSLLMKWFKEVEQLGREHFNTVIRTFKTTTGLYQLFPYACN